MHMWKCQPTETPIQYWMCSVSGAKHWGYIFDIRGMDVTEKYWNKVNRVLAKNILITKNKEHICFDCYTYIYIISWECISPLIMASDLPRNQFRHESGTTRVTSILTGACEAER